LMRLRRTIAAARRAIDDSPNTAESDDARNSPLSTKVTMRTRATSTARATV